MALVGMAPDGMRVTVLALNVLVATIGTVSYMRAGHFAWRTFYPFAVLSIPAAFVGGAFICRRQFTNRLLASSCLPRRPSLGVRRTRLL